MQEREIDYITKYREIAEKHIESERYEDAVSVLNSAICIKENPYMKCDKEDGFELYGDLAEVYAKMGLYSLSNQYWFYYLSEAPKEMKSVAYQELGINYFYLDNYWASGYYFQMKMKEDGSVSQDGLSQEIIDFISEITDNKDMYYIAYPFKEADYSYKKKRAKQALLTCSYAVAESLFSEIPSECMDEESFGEYATCCMILDKSEEAERVCKESIKTLGENATAYCNLSSHYHVKGDKDKSAYYYQKALEFKKGDVNEDNKIVLCAIEQKDDETACKCLGRIVAERQGDIGIEFLYAISLANLGQYSNAKTHFNHCYKLDSANYVYKFFNEFSNKLCEKDKKSIALLPLNYVSEIPEKITKNYKKAIQSVVDKNGTSKVKTLDLDMIRWGVYNNELSAVQCAFYLLFSRDKKVKKILSDALMDISVSDIAKRNIICQTVAMGFKDTLSVVAGDLFVKIKPRKMVFEGKEDEVFYMSTYGLAVSKLAFVGVNEFDKLAFSMNKLYSGYRPFVEQNKFTPQEVACISSCITKFSEKDETKLFCKVFEVKEKRIKEFLELFKEIEG